MKKSITLIIISLASFIGCSEQKQSTTSTTSTPSTGSFILETTIAEPDKMGTPPDPVKEQFLDPVAQSVPKPQVPKGTILLSKEKPVTASDEFPIIGELSYVTDGEKEGGEGYYLDLYEGLQWVQIDLEEEATLSAIWIWHANSWPEAAHDVIVQVSKDPAFEKGVTTLFNNDYDNSANMGKGRDRPYVETQFGKLVDARNTEARYVRLFSDGSTARDANRYVEVEVYGKP
ncbi:MAG: hypothetical protein AAFY98_10685 [Verrucomicrobiota bacterium]